MDIVEQWSTVFAKGQLTNGVHGVRRQLKDTIEHESTTLKEHVSPIPAIIFYDVMSLSFDPKVERN